MLGSTELSVVTEISFIDEDTNADDVFGFASALTPMEVAAPGKDIARGTRIGEYEIETKLAEGAMGTVYRAVHPTIGKRVAIKIINPRVFAQGDAVVRFVGEARAVAAIRHPNIVQVFGFGQLPDSRTYLTMEWLEGISLGARLTHGQIPFHEALHIIQQITRALEAAHGKGVVHRDLKPENVFLEPVPDELPNVKLLDFGIAKVAKPEANVAVTQPGQILGTPQYMSPEQASGKPIDHRTDIYALGCVGFELMTGRLPFQHKSVVELLTARLSGEPPRARSFNPDVPIEIDALLHRKLAKDPQDRPTLADVRTTVQSSTTGAHAVAMPLPAGRLDEPPARPSYSALEDTTIRRDSPLTLDRVSEIVPAPAPVDAEPSQSRSYEIIIGLVVAIAGVLAAVYLVATT